MICYSNRWLVLDVSILEVISWIVKLSPWPLTVCTSLPQLLCCLQVKSSLPSSEIGVSPRRTFALSLLKNQICLSLSSWAETAQGLRVWEGFSIEGKVDLTIPSWAATHCCDRCRQCRLFDYSLWSTSRDYYTLIYESIDPWVVRYWISSSFLLIFMRNIVFLFVHSMIAAYIFPERIKCCAAGGMHLISLPWS